MPKLNLTEYQEYTVIKVYQICVCILNHLANGEQFNKITESKTFWSVAINFYKSIELINESKTENPVIHLRKSGNRSFSIKCFTPKKSNRRRNILEFES